VVLSTLAGAGEEALDVLGGLDMAVVDEAAQATEPATWLALLRARRAVLAGDSKQLPPTILSQEAAAQVRISTPSQAIAPHTELELVPPHVLSRVASGGYGSAGRAWRCRCWSALKGCRAARCR
jgi:hypothetical protein